MKCADSEWNSYIEVCYCNKRRLIISLINPYEEASIEITRDAKSMHKKVSSLPLFNKFI